VPKHQGPGSFRGRQQRQRDARRAALLAAQAGPEGHVNHGFHERGRRHRGQLRAQPAGRGQVLNEVGFEGGGHHAGGQVRGFGKHTESGAGGPQEA